MALRHEDWDYYNNRPLVGRAVPAQYQERSDQYADAVRSSQTVVFDAQAEIAALKAKLSEYEARQLEFRAQVDAIRLALEMLRPL